jgi:hypothetical protein
MIGAILGDRGKHEQPNKLDYQKNRERRELKKHLFAISNKQEVGYQTIIALFCRRKLEIMIW